MPPRIFGAILHGGAVWLHPHQVNVNRHGPGQASRLSGALALAYLTRYVRSRLVIAICGNCRSGGSRAACWRRFCDNNKQAAKWLVAHLVGSSASSACFHSGVLQRAWDTPRKLPQTPYFVSLASAICGSANVYRTVRPPDHAGAAVSIAVRVYLLILISIYAAFTAGKIKSDSLDMSQFEKFDNSGVC